MSKREESRKAELRMSLQSETVARKHLEIVHERLQVLFDEARMYKAMQHPSRSPIESQREVYQKKENDTGQEIQKMLKKRDSLERVIINLTT